MKYITISDLSNTIRNNLWKIPRDIDVIVGIPRSGMIVAEIIAEYLNLPCVDIDNYVSGCTEGVGGGRLRYVSNRKKYNRVLVVDDTVFTGISKEKAKKQLKEIDSSVTFIFLVAYLEGYAINTIDIFLEDVRQYTNNYKEPVLYEWNIFHHNEATMISCIYDLDGVLCIEPPDERNTKEYEEYIKNAIALFCPTTTIGAIQTFRLNKYRNETADWLEKNGIKYNRLIMFNAGSWDERNESGVSSSQYKAAYYGQQGWAKLFIESSDIQAREIHQYTKKPVYSVERNCLYSV